jgi:Domain of unknown function (DUF6473)/Sulfotransferase family
MMEPTGLFIVGCPRSGTSLLHAAMNLHPQVSLGLERFNLRAFRGELTVEDFEPARFFDIQPGDTWYTETAQFGSDHQNLREKYRDASIRGDKIPRGFTVYKQLGGVFAETRFIACFRNIFSVAASYEKRRKQALHWNPEWDFRAAVEHWNASIEATLDWMRYLPILPVLYADMTFSLAAAGHIGRFLEIDSLPIERFLRRNAEAISATDAFPGLLDNQAEYVSRHADFAAYARIVALATEPPNFHQRHAVLGIGPKVVDKYSSEDGRILSYEGWQMPGIPYIFRGPKPDHRIEESIVCIGSAATFGRFVPRPFTFQISDQVQVPMINLGIGGARPATYLADARIVDILRRCRMVIVEVMSARGYRSSLFTPNNEHSNLGSTALDLSVVPALRPLIGKMYFVDMVYSAALRKQLDLSRIVMELRSAYILDMKLLAELVKGKGILLYISQRRPDYIVDQCSYESWSGNFPHFIDRRMIDLISGLFEEYVEHVSKSGLPNALCDKDTGEALPMFPGTNHEAANNYYPSPQMHDEVADRLVPTVRRMLSQ